jgi:hypothetical protein
LLRDLIGLCPICLFLERVVSMVHPHLERLRRMLDISETQRRDAEVKLAYSEAKLEESKFAIASLQASTAALQNTLNQSIQETNYCKQARLAFEE